MLQHFVQSRAELGHLTKRENLEELDIPLTSFSKRKGGSKMKKLAIIFSLLAVCGFIYGACGDDNGGPTCKKLIDCEPACATDGTEMCDMTSGNCIKMCDPICDYAGGEVCCGTTCQAAEVCTPDCTAPDTCNSCTGNCDTPVDPPVCDPACAADEYCS
jgi:hypothetical protein